MLAVTKADLTGSTNIKLPGHLLDWLREEQDRQAVGRDILIAVAVYRLKADLEAYGWVEGMPALAPGTGREALRYMSASLETQ